MKCQLFCENRNEAIVDIVTYIKHLDDIFTEHAARSCLNCLEEIAWWTMEENVQVVIHANHINDFIPIKWITDRYGILNVGQRIVTRFWEYIPSRIIIDYGDGLKCLTIDPNSIFPNSLRHGTILACQQMDRSFVCTAQMDDGTTLKNIPLIQFQKELD